MICSFDFIGGGPTRYPPGYRWSKTPRPGRVKWKKHTEDYVNENLGIIIEFV